MSLRLSLALVAVSQFAMAACSGDDATSDAGASASDASILAIDASGRDADVGAADAGSFSLSSSAYAEGGVIPTVHACPGATGSNTSPPLAWENAPEGTQSFGLVFFDTTNSFLHSVSWDIPGSRSSLPANVELAFEPASVPGSEQAPSYLGTPGYAGPCPPSEHVYEFKLHALDVATLPGLGEQTSKEQAKAAIEAASIGSTTLTGSFDPNNP